MTSDHQEEGTIPTILVIKHMLQCNFLGGTCFCGLRVELGFSAMVLEVCWGRGGGGVNTTISDLRSPASGNNTHHHSDEKYATV